MEGYKIPGSVQEGRSVLPEERQIDSDSFDSCGGQAVQCRAVLLACLGHRLQAVGRAVQFHTGER
eukprot:5015845-Pyramimonas_sp.AAC.1